MCGDVYTSNCRVVIPSFVGDQTKVGTQHKLARSGSDTEASVRGMSIACGWET